MFGSFLSNDFMDLNGIFTCYLALLKKTESGYPNDGCYRDNDFMVMGDVNETYFDITECFHIVNGNNDCDELEIDY